MEPTGEGASFRSTRMMPDVVARSATGVSVGFAAPGENVEGVAPVCGEEVEGGFGVASAQSGDKFSMLGGDVIQVILGAAADSAQQEKMNLATNRFPGLLEALVLRGGVHGVVEGDVPADHLVLVHGAIHPIDRLFDGDERFLGGVRDDTLDGEGLQCTPQTVQLRDIIRGQRCHRRTAMPFAAHQALALQPKQRLTYGSATDIQRRGQLHLAQWLARGVSPAENGVPYPVRHFVGQPAAARGSHPALDSQVPHLVSCRYVNIPTSVRLGIRTGSRQAGNLMTISDPSIPRFHLAMPVDDLAAARHFYGEVLGLAQGRSADTWVDWNLYGHQFVTHLAPGRARAGSTTPSTVTMCRCRTSA